MADSLREYEDVLRRGLDDIFVIATRWGVDVRRLIAEFDVNRPPGPHAHHILVVSVRNTSVSVTSAGIPHEWLGTATGFVDLRFSRVVTSLLADLTVGTLAGCRNPVWM